MMYSGYWDDYMDEGNSPRKDYIQNMYRIVKSERIVAEGTEVRKRVLKGHQYTKAEMRKFDNTARLKELGYTVFKRQWNLTIKEWHDDVWKDI